MVACYLANTLTNTDDKTKDLIIYYQAGIYR